MVYWVGMKTYLDFPIKVISKSHSSEIVGRLGDRLKIKIRSAPEVGKANIEVIELLAIELGVLRRQIELISGLRSAEKRVRITPRDAKDLVRIRLVCKAWMR